jgi:hypothetical protein
MAKLLSYVDAYGRKGMIVTIHPHPTYKDQVLAYVHRDDTTVEYVRIPFGEEYHWVVNGGHHRVMIELAQIDKAFNAYLAQMIVGA